MILVWNISVHYLKDFAKCHGGLEKITVYFSNYSLHNG